MLPSSYSSALAATGVPLAVQVAPSARTLIKVLLSAPTDAWGFALFPALVHPDPVQLL